MWVKNTWAWIAANAEPLKIIFAIIAAGYVLFEYRSGLTDAAIKQTMAFQARYSQGDLLKAHLDLNSMLMNPDNQEILSNAAKPSEEISKMVTASKYERNVILLADFFSQLTTCVQSGVCDRETSCAVFKPRIVAHWNNYYDLFMQRWGTWGQNLRAGFGGYAGALCIHKLLRTHNLKRGDSGHSAILSWPTRGEPLRLLKRFRIRTCWRRPVANRPELGGRPAMGARLTPLLPLFYRDSAEADLACGVAASVSSTASGSSNKTSSAVINPGRANCPFRTQSRIARGAMLI